MPKDYELATPPQVAEEYHGLGLQCNKVIKYELKKYGLDTPKQFLGANVPDLMKTITWLRNRPDLAKLAKYEQEHKQLVKRPSNISPLPWKMLNQFIVAEPYLKAKQGCFLACESAKKAHGYAIWADVTNTSSPFDLWRINPKLVEEWRTSSLSKDEIEKLSSIERKAYLHKLQDDEKHRDRQKTKQKKQTVGKLQERRLQIIQNILDSRPFYFSASVLSQSIDPEYILEHLTSDQKRYIEERAKDELNVQA